MTTNQIKDFLKKENVFAVVGERCYYSLSELPQRPDVVDTVVPAEVTEKIVEECKKLGTSMDATRL